jgi:hypothetical protein
MMYMVMSCYQKARQSHNLQSANISFENVANFKRLRIKITVQICTQEEIKSILKSGNASYNSVQNRFVFLSPL